MSKNLLVRAVTFLGGLYFALRFFVPAILGGEPPLAKYHEPILVGFTAVGAAAVGLGIISLLMIHGKKIAYLKTGWSSSLVLLTGLFLMFGAGVYDWADSISRGKTGKRLFVLRDFAQVLETRKEKGEDISLGRKALLDELSQIRDVDGKFLIPDKKEESDLGAYISKKAGAELEKANNDHDNSLSKKLFSFLYDGVFVALGAAMFSLLGCYIASAAFRAFRIRSIESGLMMIAALLVIFGQIPWGQEIWEAFPMIRMWLLNIPSAGAFRAIEVGSAIAALVLAWRIWLGLDISRRS